MPRAGAERAGNVAGLLARHGMAEGGWFAFEAADIPAGDHGVAAGMAGMLVANHGPAMWEAFSLSPEHGDGGPHPLDRWTQRVIGDIAEAAGSLAVLHPFGEIFWPFQRFAKRATGMAGSPLGLLIHPEYGLWHALRAVLVFEADEVAREDVPKPIHPCDACIEKPCLSACPVAAFSVTGFAVDACRSYLDSTASSCGDSIDRDCMMAGCAARDACPVGRKWRYRDEQVRFHMRSFRGG